MIKREYFSFLVFACFMLESAFAQHSPNGRIDIMNQQEQAEQEGKRDLIFKSSQPLPTLTNKETFVSGTSLCEVEIATNYSQRGDFIEVEALVENSQCEASNGKYTVNVRTQDAAGNINLVAYNEIWSKDDGNSVQKNHRYSMSGDVELVSVRVKMPPRDYCTCLE